MRSLTSRTLLIQAVSRNPEIKILHETAFGFLKELALRRFENNFPIILLIALKNENGIEKRFDYKIFIKN